MATSPRKTALNSSGLEATLSTTRLNKLAVETFLSADKSGTGKLHISFKSDLQTVQENENLIVIHLSVKGKGLSAGEETQGQVAFTINAAIDGMYTLSRKPKEGELVGRETSLANYLIPILSDMIETLLSKCGYLGISLPRSFPPKPAPSAVAKKPK